MSSPNRFVVGCALVLLVGTASSSSFAAAPAGAPGAPGTPSAHDIMVKSEEARRLKDITSDATVTTTTEGGDTKVKTFTWWRKLADNATHYKTLTRFKTPAEVRGEGILIDEHDTGSNDVFLYLPTFKKIRRVEGQSQSSSFMGTAFSYSDIAQPHVEDYNHKHLRSEPCPDEASVGCFVIESVPKTDATRERTGYSKTVQWIRADNFVPIHSELTDAQGQLWKRLVTRDIHDEDPATHKWFAREVRVEDLRSKKKSVIVFVNVRVNTGIPSATFSQQYLGRE